MNLKKKKPRLLLFNLSVFLIVCKCEDMIVPTKPLQLCKKVKLEHWKDIWINPGLKTIVTISIPMRNDFGSQKVWYHEITLIFKI